MISAPLFSRRTFTLGVPSSAAASVVSCSRLPRAGRTNRAEARTWCGWCLWPQHSTAAHELRRTVAAKQGWLAGSSPTTLAYFFSPRWCRLHPPPCLCRPGCQRSARRECASGRRPACASPTRKGRKGGVGAAGVRHQWNFGGYCMFVPALSLPAAEPNCLPKAPSDPPCPGCCRAHLHRLEGWFDTQRHARHVAIALLQLCPPLQHVRMQAVRGWVHSPSALLHRQACMAQQQQDQAATLQH